MSMTRQHFQLIADALRSERPAIGDPAFPLWARLCKRFAEDLGRTNALFNTERFLTACGLD